VLCSQPRPTAEVECGRLLRVAQLQFAAPVFSCNGSTWPKNAPKRLAAILAADVVGYSRLMEAAEVGTLAALKARRSEILQALVPKHHGRIVKVMGDGVLVEFTSAVQAVSCAVALQGAMAVANEDAAGWSCASGSTAATS
jgi:class 3 adenylate cyclase